MHELKGFGMSSAEFVTLGQSMGLQGAELKAWVDEQSEKARADRQAEREATKERLELEERVLALRLKLAESGNSQERDAGARQERNESPMMINPHSLIPVFKEDRDDLDAYLKRFESVATGQGWPLDKWATALSLCLDGEALKVFGRLSPEESVDYDKAKKALLQRFRCTAEGYREKFRLSKPQDEETAKQYATRLLSFFDRWMEMANRGKTFEAVRDIIVSEQLLQNCHRRLTLFLRERNYQTLDEIAEAADHYMEAQGHKNLLVFKERPEEGATKEKEGSSSGKTQVRCFVCDRYGHKTSDCRMRSKQQYCTYCRKTGHNVQDCRRKGSGTKEVAGCVSMRSRSFNRNQESRLRDG